MAFTDLNFLSRFLPLFIIAFYLSPRRFQTVELFIGSLLFYALGDPQFLPILIALCGVNFLLAKISKSQEGTEGRQWILAAIVFIDVAVLVVFKLLGLFYGMHLPIGISFYIFKMLSYQVDIYQGKIKQVPDFLESCAYFTLFFQITQGPIMRYSKAEFASSKHRMSLIRMENGLKTMIIGLAMKTILADRLAILWNEAVKVGFGGISTPLAWMVAIGYSLQLYMDFWGYSLMASGIGVILGFSPIDNFAHPYAATSIGEFYRRWHMTLTSWFRDYVYIPLGGSRKSVKRTLINIMLVWLLTGFWHGGGLHFVLWGLFLGLFICAEKLFLARFFEKFPILGHLYVLLVIPVSWMFFAPSSTVEVGRFMARLFPLTGKFAGASSEDFITYFHQFSPYLFVSGALCAPPVFKLLTKDRSGVPRILESVLLLILLWIGLYQINISQANPFLYFNF